MGGTVQHRALRSRVSNQASLGEKLHATPCSFMQVVHAVTFRRQLIGHGTTEEFAIFLRPISQPREL